MSSLNEKLCDLFLLISEAPHCMRQGAAAGVRAQVSSFNEVRDNLSEGLRFYSSLQEALTSLQQHVGDFCLTRRIQRCASLDIAFEYCSCFLLLLTSGLDSPPC